MKPKVFLLIGDYSFNVALAHKISEHFEISGIVYERRERVAINKFDIKEIIDKIFTKILLRKLHSSWINLQNYFTMSYPNYLNVPELFVENINSKESVDFYKKNPSPLILVSGTRLINQGILDLQPEIGILNLHTGLSPYINGGPNCTNWCLSNNTFHLIGNTVMWIDLGIDSGNIISTKAVDFSGDETLAEVYIKVFEESHELYINAVRCIFETPELVPSIQQLSVAEGITYYNKAWTFIKKYYALKNFRNFYKTVKSAEYMERKKNLKAIHCPIK